MGDFARDLLPDARVGSDREPEQSEFRPRPPRVPECRYVVQGHEDHDEPADNIDGKVASRDLGQTARQVRGPQSRLYARNRMVRW